MIMSRYTALFFLSINAMSVDALQWRWSALFYPQLQRATDAIKRTRFSNRWAQAGLGLAGVALAYKMYSMRQGIDTAEIQSIATPPPGLHMSLAECVEHSISCKDDHTQYDRICHESRHSFTSGEYHIWYSFSYHPRDKYAKEHRYTINIQQIQQGIHLLTRREIAARYGDWSTSHTDYIPALEDFMKFLCGELKVLDNKQLVTLQHNKLFCKILMQNLINRKKTYAKYVTTFLGSEMQGEVNECERIYPPEEE